jgi:hypothetical protein
MNHEDTPLVYTTRGNLPHTELVFSTAWEDTADYTKLTETYKAADGEIVRQDVHVMGKHAVPPMGVAQASF